MHPSSIIFLLTLAVYIPLSSVLLYVWHKFGRGDHGVRTACAVYGAGSLLIIFYMLFL